MNLSAEDILSFQKGDEKALKLIYQELSPQLLYKAKRTTRNDEEAKDIVEKAFITLWEKCENFHTSSGIAAYLLTVVRNDCLNYIEVRNRVDGNKVNPEEVGDTLYADEDDIFESFVRTKLAQKAIEEIYRLKEGICKQVLILSFIEGKKTGEIALALGIPSRKVSDTKYEGLKKIREKLLPHQHNYWLFNMLVFTWFSLYILFNGNSFVAFLKKILSLFS